LLRRWLLVSFCASKSSKFKDILNGHRHLSINIPPHVIFERASGLGEGYVGKGPADEAAAVAAGDGLAPAARPLHPSDRGFGARRGQGPIEKEGGEEKEW